MSDDKAIYRATYSPAPALPPFWEARMAQIFGRRINGEPKGRVVWGCDARGFPHPDNQELKYASPNDPLVGWNCWVLEQWVGPQFFGDPDEWERLRWAWVDGRRVEVMAPFPHEGEYILVMPLATPNGEPFPLGDQALEFIEWLMAGHHQAPHNAYTQQQLIAARLEKLRAAREERRKEVGDELAKRREEILSKTEQTNAAQTRAYDNRFAGAAGDLRARAARFLGRKETPKQ